MIKLSIIVPFYNLEQNVPILVPHLLAQLNSICELILIDDASTDTTAEKLRQYCDNHALCTLIINSENKGPGATRNVGLQHATGQYVVFIDGDDDVPLYYVHEILKAIKSNKDYYKMGWDEHGSQTPYQQHAIKNPLAHRMMTDTVIRRDLIKTPFDEEMRFGEDAKFFRTNLTSENTYGTIDKIMYHYHRRRSGSLSEAYHKNKEAS